jgi:hypothetical protein
MIWIMMNALWVGYFANAIYSERFRRPHFIMQVLFRSLFVMNLMGVLFSLLSAGIAQW